MRSVSRDPGADQTRAPGRPRGARRQLIMERAAELFYERGFHATGIDEIGEAAGVSGPAIYRHFKSKDDLLLAILEQHIDYVAAVTEAARVEDGDAAAQLERHVRAQVQLAVEAPHMGALIAQELTNLPAADRPRIVRKIRLNRAEWLHVLAEARPDLPETALRIRMHGIVGLIRDMATARSIAEVGPDELAEITIRMVLAAIYA
jgi:AcrR family transcriptional regulator